MDNIGVIIALAGFVLNLIIFMGTLVWKLSQVQADLSNKIVKAKDEIEIKHEGYTKYIGETVSAIRQKIADVELFSANNYVRREGFYKVQEQITDDVRNIGDKIEARLLRMETKMDAFKKDLDNN